jgi:hypothetical protein
VLRERDPTTGGRDAGELPLGGAVEPQSAGDDVVAGDAQVDAEGQVGIARTSWAIIPAYCCRVIAVSL